MRKVNVKALMILTFLITSILAMPIMANAQGSGGGGDPGDAGFDPRLMGDAFDDFGISGQLLGQIFEVLLMQTIEIDDQEMTEGVYVLHGSNEEIYNGSHTFDTEKEIHFLPLLNSTEGGADNLYD